MACTNCDTELRAFTLQVEESGIELPFCSANCVDAWV
jgi:hypothetical protein